MIKYKVEHKTIYEYLDNVSQCHNLVCLLPRSTDYQRCLNNSIQVSPHPKILQRRTDYFGNETCYFSVEKPHKVLSVTCESVIEVQATRTSLDLDFGLSCDQARSFLCEQVSQETLAAREFVLDSPMIAAAEDLKDYAAPFFHADDPFLSCVRKLTTEIYRDFAYDPEFSTIATPLAEVLEHRKGVCQDFAHLAIGCLRSLGFAARYVSGYIETLPPPGQEKLVGSDATHAWLAVYSPGEGWFEFDPTNDKMAEEQHITTAWGRDYSDVSPLKGVIFGGGSQQSLSVAVDVTRVE